MFSQGCEETKNESREYEGYRALIAAILAQAVSDAVSINKSDDPQGARRFIDDKNPMFRHYCELLGFLPEYVAKKMQEKIRNHSLKKLKQLKE